METNILLIVIFAVLSQLVYGIVQQRKSYGETCSETSICDKRAWLGCNNSTCACILEDKMVFDPTRSKCVSKASEICKFQVNTQGSGTLAIYETTDCIKDSSCGDIESYCVCNSGFYESLNGTCSPQKTFNKTCSVDEECRLNLKCFQNQCHCDSTNFVYESANSSVKDCYGMAGKPLAHPGVTCISGAINANGICKCFPEDDFYDGTDGRCYLRKKHTEYCNSHKECNYKDKFLQCFNNTCSCDAIVSKYNRVFRQEKRLSKLQYGKKYQHDNDNEIYITAANGNKYRGFNHRQDTFNPSYYYLTVPEYTAEYNVREGCVGLAGKSCNLDKSCIIKATCDINNICKCDTGFTRNSNGECGSAYNGICSKDISCSDKFTCKMGQCSCASMHNQIYDTGMDKCFALVHAACESNSDCFANGICEINIKTGFQECNCKAGYVRNKDGKCELAYGSRCEYGVIGEQCDTMGGLLCTNGVCACPDTTLYFEQRIRKCVGVVGAPCGKITTDYEIKCVDHAYCYEEFTDLPGQCLCFNGFNITTDKLCSNLEISQTLIV